MTTVHRVIVNEAVMNDAVCCPGGMLVIPSVSGIRRGDMVELQSDEDPAWVRPPRPVAECTLTLIRLYAEETFAEALRRWSLQDKKEKRQERLRRYRDAQVSCDANSGTVY